MRNFWKAGNDFRCQHHSHPLASEFIQHVLIDVIGFQKLNLSLQLKPLFMDSVKFSGVLRQGVQKRLAIGVATWTVPRVPSKIAQQNEAGNGDDGVESMFVHV